MSLESVCDYDVYAKMLCVFLTFLIALTITNLSNQLLNYLVTGRVYFLVQIVFWCIVSVISVKTNNGYPKNHMVIMFE